MRHAFLIMIGVSISAGTASAQGFWGGELARGSQPGASVPYDGAPWTHRYNYDVGQPLLYLNGTSGRNQFYLDYYDRYERAYKFGYKEPIDPFVYGLPASNPASTPNRTRVQVGVGFGRWR